MRVVKAIFRPQPGQGRSAEDHSGDVTRGGRGIAVVHDGQTGARDLASQRPNGPASREAPLTCQRRSPGARVRQGQVIGGGLSPRHHGQSGREWTDRTLVILDWNRRGLPANRAAGLRSLTSNRTLLGVRPSHPFGNPCMAEPRPGR